MFRPRSVLSGARLPNGDLAVALGAGQPPILGIPGAFEEALPVAAAAARSQIRRIRAIGGFTHPCHKPDPPPAVASRATRDCHHSAPRSRRANISSHVASICIGLPHIRIDNGPRSVRAKVS